MLLSKKIDFINLFYINAKMKQKIYSIEGNIGAGKSTLIEQLSLQENKSVIFVEEPVKEWQTIKMRNEDILSKFYSDPLKWGFSFQMMAYISRLARLKEICKQNPNAIIITERSVYTDKFVFAKMLYDDGKINDIDYQIYNKWHAHFLDETPISGIIYLKCSADTAYKRVIKRNRPGETISKDYLARCKTYHEDWLKTQKNVLTIDCEKKVADYMKDIIPFISNK